MSVPVAMTSFLRYSYVRTHYKEVVQCPIQLCPRDGAEIFLCSNSRYGIAILSCEA